MKPSVNALQTDNTTYLSIFKFKQKSFLHFNETLPTCTDSSYQFDYHFTLSHMREVELSI